MKKWTALLFVILSLLAILTFAPPYIEQTKNKITPHSPYPISLLAKQLHQSLFIGDWHSDSTLWSRDLIQESTYGHMDIPRLKKGNVAIQMFTTTTKSPAGQNYHNNHAAGIDNITLLAILQQWPIKTWHNLTERAIYQAQKLTSMADSYPQKFKLVTNRQSLNELIQERKTGSQVIGGLLGTEGSHALEGDISNIERLHHVGFRMMSLQHFFDNKLGGSLHGASKSGLTAFGKNVVKEINRLNIILDVSHSSEQVVKDVLELSITPIILSHTGLKGFCDSPRNINDHLVKEIANKGGLIALGYWDGAACGISPKKIAQQIAYGVKLVGARHISLGSDFDGAVTTGFDTSQLSLITHELLSLKMSKTDIQLVMGENMKNFLLKHLPEN